MSATTMETLTARPTPYTTTLGFKVPSPCVTDSAPVPIEPMLQLTGLTPIATAKRLPSLPQPPTPPSSGLLPRPPRTISPAPPAPPAHVGWKGLLEISRTSGASGVLGCPAAVDEELGRDTKIEICCTAHTNNSVRRLVKSVIRGLKACQEPERAMEGMGGTYFFGNEDGRKVAILKPCDEEPLAPNNPKGYVGRSLGEPGWKPTVRVGEAAMREVAAYLLDRDGFARVPTSVLVRARHPIFCYNNRMSSVRQSALDLTALSNNTNNPAADLSTDDCSPPGSLPMKLGSLQEFVTHMCDTSEMGPSRFSVRDVHRIGILDVRLFNTDRHAGNMLVRVVRSPQGASKVPSIIGSDTEYELIPIDHGFCLPETLEACYFEWLHWPQAMLPFSEEELKYIADIDIEADKELLRKELPNLRPECLRVMELSTTLLKRGAEAGLTLFDIASVMTRPFEGGEEEPSELEKTAASAKQVMDEEEEFGDVIEECDSEDCNSSDVSTVDTEGSDCDEDVHMGGLADPRHVMAHSSSSELGHQTSSRAEYSMLFELEEDYGNGAPSTPQRGAARSPGAASLGSSLSSADAFSFGTSSLVASYGTPAVSSGAETGLHNKNKMAVLDAARPAGAAAAGAAAPTSMAFSVCVADGGFLMRRAHRRSVQKRATKHHGSRTKTVLARSPQPYPPPVVAFAPESLNCIFRDMDEVQWERFMATWGAAVTAKLRTGDWRQDIKTRGAPVAQSCPRF